jgi:hypothetical protein
VSEKLRDPVELPMNAEMDLTRPMEMKLIIPKRSRYSNKACP